VNLDDHRHLERAEGWLGLGDWQSANDELDENTPQIRAHPDVLLVRVEVYLKAGSPNMAQPVARTLTKARGGDWHVHYALAQTEAALGNFKAAQAALERAFALKDVRLKALADPLLAKVWRDW